MFLKVENLTHTFDKKLLYQNASFTVNRGEKIGIVGSNGTGKTTLIKILNGDLIPDSGDITFEKSIKVGFLDQYLRIDKNLTIQEYLDGAFKELNEVSLKLEKLQEEIAVEIDPQILEQKLEQMENLQERLYFDNYYQKESNILRVAVGLGVSQYGMDTSISKLSGGQKIKVILTKLLLENPNFLILDEPTNFLDAIHVDWLVKYLKEYKGTVLMVSHNQEFLNDVCNYIIDIDYKTITKYKGNYEQYLIKKEFNLVQHEKQVERNIRERKALQDYIDKNKVRASTAKQAQSRQKKLDKMEDIKELKSDHRKLFLTFNYRPISSTFFLRVNDLEIGYYSPLLPPISFSIKSGEKLAITGFNGIGKTTLLKTLIGELRPMGGSFKFVEDALISYFPQEETFEKGKSAIKIISDIYPEMDEKTIRSNLAKVALKQDQTMQDVSTLSGGELSKLKLALVMLKKANVLILDEPTNHLDSDAKESLLEALKKYPGTVIFVCHEKAFIEKLATKVYNIEDLLL